VFSRIEILQEFAEAARTMGDQTADWSAKMFRWELEYTMRRLGYKNDPWNRRRERIRDKNARKDPEVKAQRSERAKAYYLANREKLLARTRLTNQARKAAREAQKAVSR
jgi:hypothetical protein